MNSTVQDIWKDFGFVLILDILISHVLKGRDLMNGIDIYEFLFKCEENNSFLKQIITGIKNWLWMFRASHRWTENDIHKNKIFYKICTIQ